MPVNRVKNTRIWKKYNQYILRRKNAFLRYTNCFQTSWTIIFFLNATITPSGVCFVNIFHLFSLRKRIWGESNNFSCWHFKKHFHVHYFMWFFNILAGPLLLEGKAMFLIFFRCFSESRPNFSLQLELRFASLVLSGASQSRVPLLVEASWHTLFSPTTMSSLFLSKYH